MRTFQGHNPETRGDHSCKSQPSKKKLLQLPETVEVHIIDDDDDGSNKDYSAEDTSKQLVLYSPQITHENQRVVEVTEPIGHYTTLHRSPKKPRYGYGTVLPSIGDYTVQCACCFKWRVVPTKQKYEELRESICQELFVCARAHEWNRVLSCDDPEDISQDGSRVWAIDKPNIAQPPPGWDREVRIRGASSKFADVYYTSPSGKKLRSLVEIGRYLAEYPHYISEGVNLSQFSFAIPKPLEENYVRKCTFGEAREFPELPEVAQIDPLCWAAPPTRRELLGEPGVSTSDPVDLHLPEVLDYVDLHQPEVLDYVDLHQPDVPEPPAPRPKKRTVKPVSSKKCQRTPAAVTCTFQEQSGGHSNDTEHVLL